MENTVAWKEFEITQFALSINVKKISWANSPYIDRVRLIPNRLLRVINDS